MGFYASLTSIACGYLHVKTILAYRRLNLKAQVENREELRLLSEYLASLTFAIRKRHSIRDHSTSRPATHCRPQHFHGRWLDVPGVRCNPRHAVHVLFLRRRHLVEWTCMSAHNKVDIFRGWLLVVGWLRSIFFVVNLSLAERYGHAMLNYTHGSLCEEKWSQRPTLRQHEEMSAG